MARVSRCDWFQEKTSVHCKVDLDCPVEPLDVWYDYTIEQVNREKTPMTLSQFLEDARHKTSYKVGLDWSTDTEGGVPLTPLEMNRKLKKLVDTDTRLRTTIEQTLREDPKLRRHLSESIKNSCVDGRCTGAVSKPSVQLFDGTKEVTFAKTEDGIVYRRGDHSSFAPVLAEGCDNNPARQCRENGSRDVVRLEGNTIRSGEDVVPYYRIKFDGDDEEFLVRNMMSEKGRTHREIRDKCATSLCHLNKDMCPAPHCQRDGSRCVPNSSMVDSVSLL